MSLKACLFNMPLSPASRLSRVFFQITSKALAVESLMWSLNDLLRGPFATWFIMQIDHTSIGKRLQLGPRKKGILCPGICLNLHQAGRLLLHIICRQPRAAFPWRVRHCSSHCGCRKAQTAASLLESCQNLTSGTVYKWANDTVI